MERIIMDSFIKQDKHIYGKDREHPFNQRVLAVNQMYGWLCEQGILKKIAFSYRDCPKEIHFALDTKDLEPYRQQMEESGVPKAALSVRHLLDEPYTPCVYSGAIQPGWLMDSYREEDGVVGRSWECDLVKFLNITAASDVRQIREAEGIKAAVQKVFTYYQWPEMQEEKAHHESGVWITVYKDVLGRLDEEDNLTEICVHKDWLMNVLEAEGADKDQWFDEYTADDTQEIARMAMAEGVILSRADEKALSEKDVPAGEGRGKNPGLTSMLSGAEERAQRPPADTDRSDIGKRRER